MDNINSTFENIKANLKYITNSDDSFEIIIGKIIDKLKETGITISNTDYEILDFKESFSKVVFKIKITSREETETKDISLIVPNNDFNNSVFKNYRKAVEIYLVNSLELDISKYTVSNSDEKITKKQLEYLTDKMDNRDIENLVKKNLSEFGVDSIEKLSKKNASAILDKIQSMRKRRY